MPRSNQSANAFSAQPIRPRRAFEDVILQVREAVVDGRLAIGDRLPEERELARLFKVSRQSVREGLRMLEGFGILTARRGVGPDSGWTVSADGTSGLSVLLDLHTSLKRISVWDLLEIRESLEMLSARAAVGHATADVRDRLVTLADEMADVAEPAAFLKLDAAFHVAIAAAQATLSRRSSWRPSAMRCSVACSPGSKRCPIGRRSDRPSSESTGRSLARFARDMAMPPRSP